jgi:hypothetical protein
VPDAAELNVLSQFAQAQFAYGQQMGVQDPSIYALQALGVALASTATQFQNTFGPSNPAQPVSTAGDVPLQMTLNRHVDTARIASTDREVDAFCFSVVGKLPRTPFREGLAARLPSIPTRVRSSRALLGGYDAPEMLRSSSH